MNSDCAGSSRQGLFCAALSACQSKVSCGIRTATCEAFPEWKSTRLAKVLPWLRRSFVTVGAFDFHWKFVIKPTLPGASCLAVSSVASGTKRIVAFFLPSFSFYSFNLLAQWLCVLTCFDFIKVNGWANFLGMRKQPEKAALCRGGPVEECSSGTSGIKWNSLVYLYLCIIL